LIRGAYLQKQKFEAAQEDELADMLNELKRN